MKIHLGRRLATKVSDLITNIFIVTKEFDVFHFTSSLK